MYENKYKSIENELYYSTNRERILEQKKTYYQMNRLEILRKKKSRYIKYKKEVNIDNE